MSMNSINITVSLHYYNCSHIITHLFNYLSTIHSYYLKFIFIYLVESHYYIEHPYSSLPLLPCQFEYRFYL